ncbi:hypothetical protein PsYK624_060940 [Phanerochaete sordida]|uniref:Uncharacterized protein n=1 Tax=Phanerochaete sordida TaxID=48140 RepID=A0A9P3G7Z3_9APHY|nr:hypothetical protein PsYK624_060940 [Phanerochaete sordida]
MAEGRGKRQRGKEAGQSILFSGVNLPRPGPARTHNSTAGLSPTPQPSRTSRSSSHILKHLSPPPPPHYLVPSMLLATPTIALPTNTAAAVSVDPHTRPWSNTPASGHLEGRNGDMNIFKQPPRRARRPPTGTRTTAITSRQGT